ncbi:hypothetical protein B1F69_28890, partial [Pseudomonas syringae]|uniref:hypothetical protein n=1 Tax=Pseudomonas syringae TaxID=317 RepID=UPI0010253E25
MTEKELSALYEKLYFNETDRREKIGARLSIPMALLLAVSSLLGYMVNMAPAADSGFSAVWFWIFFNISALFWLLAAWYFRGAWANGLADKLMPTAVQIEDYKTEILKSYAHLEDAEELTAIALGKFIKNYYMEASSTNAILNDRRSLAISDTSIALE